MSEKAKILVIEDEKELREDIVDLLGWDGYEVLSADNGIVGIHLALTEVPDLIISDIMLSEIDGFGILQTLRSRSATARIPVIFLSALIEPDYIRKGMKLGADDYLTKPFKYADLLAAVQSRLERYMTIRQEYEHELEHARRSFTQMVAHELRTPLNSIVMVQDIISRRIGQLEKPEMADLMDMLGSGTRRLRHLIEQMVFLTQLETSSLTRESIQRDGGNLNLRDLLTASANIARQFMARSNGAEVIQEFADPDILIWGDPASLKHALAELISNALNFSPQGEDIQIKQWKDDQMVWIRISDYGPGISPRMQEQAQRPLQQIEHERQEQQGLGMGIYLARRLIEVHHGVFSIESTAGEGTHVTVGLRPT